MNGWRKRQIMMAQPAVPQEQEPAAWLHRQGNFTEACMNPLHDDEIDRGWMQEPLYTTPPPVPEAHKRTWVGLTDEDISTLDVRYHHDNWRLIKEVEAKLKEKNFL